VVNFQFPISNFQKGRLEIKKWQKLYYYSKCLKIDFTKNHRKISFCADGATLQQKVVLVNSLGKGAMGLTKKMKCAIIDGQNKIRHFMA